MIMKVSALIAVVTVMAVIAVSVGLLELNPLAAQAGPTNASRSLSPDPVDPGGQVSVTITAVGHGSFADVAETLPDGFTYLSSSLPEDQVTSSGQTVLLSLLGATSPTTFTYTVTASSVEGDHSFTGVFSGVDAAFESFSGVQVGGDSSIAVREGNRAPAFRRSSTTRFIDENSASGANVGGRVTASDPDRDTLTYTLTGTDASSFTINSRTGQIMVGAGITLDYENKSSYSVRVTATDPDSESASASVTVMVTNVDEDGTVMLSSMAPVVGVELTAALADPDMVTEDTVTWQWSKSMEEDGTFMDIDGATAMSYTPVAADDGYYLMAEAMYTDGHGPGKSVMKTTANMVMTGGDPLVVEYDANENGQIDKSEVITAINDYLFGEVGIISKADVIRLINLYLFG